MTTKNALLQQYLQTVFDQTADLTPERVVSLAENPDHPLHSFFPEWAWNDAEAAQRKRLDLAAGLIRSVKIKVVTDDDTYEVRYFHARRNLGQDRPGYVPDPEVREDPEQRQLLLQAMRRDMNAALRRYRHLGEFWELIKEAVDGQEGQQEAG